ncbi:MAG: hypothetical protein IH846_17920 [Acidobacteria bacterium]|nr:hypothetical protein [Acidobacteriota bacterium]
MRHHVRDQVDDYLTGLLEPEADRDFVQHAGSCRSCGKALREARIVRFCLQWLRPREESPKPSLAFYSKVQEAIEKRKGDGWFSDLAAALRPRLAYPLLSLAVLLMAWTLTFRPAESGVEFLELELPAARFANLSLSDVDSALGRDLVLMSLVDLTEVE